MQTELKQASQRVMRRVIEIITDGEFSEPRPGQGALSDDIVDTMEAGGGHLIGEAPTGTGKSFAYGVPLFVAAALSESPLGGPSRSVISTEGLALQTQLESKDFPVIQRAVMDVTGKHVPFSVLKGWSNYACALRASATAHSLYVSDTGQEFDYSPTSISGMKKLASYVEDEWLKLPPENGAFSLSFKDNGRMVSLDGFEHARREVLEALRWAIPASVGAKNLTGAPDSPITANQFGEVVADRHGAPVEISNHMWNNLSISSNACPKADNCPLGEVCRPAAARVRASEASVVITNHTLIGIQAAKQAKVVIGNSRLGTFDTIVIDEAHSLPNIVRSQGANEVSATRFERLAKRLEPMAFTVGDNNLLVSVKVVASAIEDDLQDALRVLQGGRLKPLRDGDTVTVDPDKVQPIAHSEETLVNWIEAVSSMVSTAEDRWAGSHAHRNDWLRALSMGSRLNDLKAAITDANSDSPFIARWIEKERDEDGGRLVTKLSPVVVAPMLRANVWTTPIDPDEVRGTDDDQDDDGLYESSDTGYSLSDLLRMAESENYDADEDSTMEVEQPKFKLNVIAVSATVPRNLPYEAGIMSPIKKYESPFSSAYSKSTIYIPKVGGAVRDGLISDLTRDRARPSMDTKKHAEWAADEFAEMVLANEGHALILAATTSNAKLYHDRISKAVDGRFEVYSQWSRGTTTQVVSVWKEDQPSVLVGTRGLMTGVDAPGKTLTLLGIDRLPRAASNPVDDARVAAISEERDLDKWTADLQVYVVDTAVLVEQAVGRLIRAVSDTGVVAFLDPRIVPGSQLSLAANARDIYLEALSMFPKGTGCRVAERDEVLERLRRQAKDY
jgi:ATP-dependent DNA helicase DinG